jgi:hypothetical protein
MPNFKKDARGVKDISLVAIVNDKALESLKNPESKGAYVTMMTEAEMVALRKDGKPTAAAKKALAEEFSDVNARTDFLTRRTVKDKEGKSRVARDTFYSKSQIEAMQKAAGQYGTDSLNGRTYYSFKSDVKPNGKDGYVAIGPQPTAHTKDTPFSAVAFEANKTLRHEICKELHPGKPNLAVEASAEAVAEKQAGE